MKKIRLSRPKYIIPLILIPFNAFLFYMVKDNIDQEKSEITPKEEIEAINTHIPMPNLEKRPLKSKFESFKETYKYSRDFTAMKEIDRREELEQIISPKSDPVFVTADETEMPDVETDFMASVSRRTKSFSNPIQKPKTVKPTETDYDIEMKLFKDQMKYIDSLSNAAVEANHYERLSIEDTTKKLSTSADRQKTMRIKHEGREIVKVLKTDNKQSSLFNTIKPWKKDRFIQAIIDEDIKVQIGSRVRIRLLDDIYAGEQLIEKGNYLFGIVSSFKPQRIGITISSVVLDDQIINVNLNVFDNDGLPGLYVPASQFREFTKELASNSVNSQSFQFNGSPENQSEMLYGLAEKAFSTTTQSVGKALRKNKAKLKYNTILHLVNANENN